MIEIAAKHTFVFGQNKEFPLEALMMPRLSIAIVAMLVFMHLVIEFAISILLITAAF